MPRGEVHTVNRAGLWRNELKGELRELSKHTSKAEAIARGRHYARRRSAEHVIHNLDGTVAERRTY